MSPPSAVPAKLVIYQDNTQQIRVFGLKDIVSGNFVSTATLLATLEDRDGNNVSGLIGVSLTYQTSSNGDYFGLVGPDFAPTCGTEFRLVIDGDDSGSHLHIEIPTEVQVRQR